MTFYTRALETDHRPMGRLLPPFNPNGPWLFETTEDPWGVGQPLYMRPLIF